MAKRNSSPGPSSSWERIFRHPWTAVIVAGTGLVLASQVAVELLSPGLVDRPQSVPPEQVLSPARAALATDYRGDLRLLTVLAILIELALLAWLATGHPARCHAWLNTGAGHLGRAALCGGLLAVAITMATMPLALLRRERSIEVGLNAQDLGGWVADVAVSLGIAAALAAAGAVLLLILQRRLGNRWLLGGWASVVAYAVAITWVGPLLIAPLFSHVEKLPDGPVRASVDELASRAGVEIGEVYAVDASRRSTALNAYVAGIGSTRRVVIYDTTAEALDLAALRAVIAHELAHISQQDVLRGLLFLALVAPFGLVFVDRLAARLISRTNAPRGSPAAIPAYAFSLALATLIAVTISNQLSRDVESKADRIALELTGDADGQIQLQRRLAARNLSEPNPPRWAVFLFSTHPPAAERIAAAEAFDQGLDE